MSRSARLLVAAAIAALACWRLLPERSPAAELPCRLHDAARSLEPAGRSLRQMCFFGGWCGNPSWDPRLNRSRHMLELLEPGDQRLRIEVPGYWPAEMTARVFAKRYVDLHVFLMERWPGLTRPRPTQRALQDPGSR